MKLNVEVMSKEIIKPSSPTSDQFRCYRLSFLDQISPPVYNPLILFYRLTITEGNIKTDDKIKIIDYLKQSLTDVLTYFYPLAGRIKDNMFVNCNDEGVPFGETRVQWFEPRSGISTEKIVTKRFAFTALKIQEIKANIGDTTYPSRIAALSAFIWTRFIATTQANATHEGEDNRFYAIVHAVNLRKRFDPPLPDHSFGNLYRIAMTIPTKNSQQDCRNLVNQIGESIRKIDAEYIKQLRDGLGRHLEFMRESIESFMKGEMITFNVTSLCNFPVYEADFGWGKPVWVGSAGLTFKNLVVFMDPINGDGIEAWISLKEEEMGTFENDEIMRAFVVS
ncbi:hypothetical protein E1A91_A04G175400v1 [Gossypium mustelinum]|uniref:Uncharacterized protein n=1 Tax=Gossypium mustelinum TaxID=34275 RepID=A0A5D2ZPS5_GOSMU|nr:hypothetical protein E1A91_A04G175400v1 [Gossypium mustelinum]